MKEGKLKTPMKETVIVTTPLKKVTLANPNKEEVILFIVLQNLFTSIEWVENECINNLVCNAQFHIQVCCWVSNLLFCIESM